MFFFFLVSDLKYNMLFSASLLIKTEVRVAYKKTKEKKVGACGREKTIFTILMR